MHIQRAQIPQDLAEVLQHQQQVVVFQSHKVHCRYKLALPIPTQKKKEGQPHQRMAVERTCNIQESLANDPMNCMLHVQIGRAHV